MRRLTRPIFRCVYWTNDAAYAAELERVKSEQRTKQKTGKKDLTQKIVQGSRGERSTDHKRAVARSIGVAPRWRFVHPSYRFCSPGRRFKKSEAKTVFTEFAFPDTAITREKTLLRDRDCKQILSC